MSAHTRTLSPISFFLSFVFKNNIHGKKRWVIVFHAGLGGGRLTGWKKDLDLKSPLHVKMHYILATSSWRRTTAEQIRIISVCVRSLHEKVSADSLTRCRSGSNPSFVWWWSGMVLGWKSKWVGYDIDQMAGHMQWNQTISLSRYAKNDFELWTMRFLCDDDKWYLTIASDV